MICIEIKTNNARNFSDSQLTRLRNQTNYYEFNGVKYEVNVKFQHSESSTDTISDRIFRIVENGFAHLMADKQDDIINTEYACLTARREA